MKRCIATTLIGATPLSVLLWLSGALPLPQAFAAVALFAFFVVLSGSLALRALRLADLAAPAAWVAGVFASSLAVYALVAWLDLLAMTAFAVWASVVVAWALLFREREPEPRLDWQDLAGFAFCALVTTMWCHSIAQATAVLEHDGVFFAWIDYFVHGSVISQFGDPLAMRGSVFVADQALFLYHYASYMLPAAFAGLADQPGLALATSFWLPMGVLTMCAGTYVLGAELGGSTGGLASVAVLTLVPDASTYGLRNGFLSFHFHMVGTPGANYVVGIFLLCAALLARRAMLGSAVLAAGAVWFRVQVFALGFPAWLATAALGTPALRSRKLLVLSGGLMAFVLFVIAFYTFTDSDIALPIFLNAIHDWQSPTAYDGLYVKMINTLGPDYALVPGILLMYTAFLGAFVAVYPLSVWASHRAGVLRTIDFFPVFLLVIYLLLMLTAPTDKHRDSTEYTVRPFVLVYAALGVWTVCLLWRAMAARWPRRGAFAWRGVLGISLLAVPVVWHKTPALRTLPKFNWGWDYYPTRIEAGLVEAARYLRGHGRPGQIFAVRGLRLNWAVTDPAIQLISLSGMPAYLSYTSAPLVVGGDLGRVAMERYAELAQHDRAASADSALRQLGRLGIAWYVVTDGEGPPWDRDRHRAAFVERNVAIYAVPRS